uniref:GOLD domain-containing protein n=1 Tax=Trichuris muris TaxID=70415 RepID=A0A5S6PZQ0_TRIMR
MNVLGVLAILLSIAWSTGREESFSIVVPASRLQCFFEPIYDSNYTTMLLDYQVLHGGDRDINLLVLDPKADVVVQETRNSEGSYQLDITAKGDYQICFDNTFSYQTAKAIFFQVELLRTDGTTDDFGANGLADPTGIVTHLNIASEVLKERLQRLRQKLSSAERYQALARAHETRDRMLVNDKLNVVNFWSMFNMSSLLIVGALQIYIIRSLFEDNSRVGRLLRQHF